MMTDVDKLRNLTKQIDEMLINYINPSSEEFTIWRTKTERILEKIYGEDSKEHKDFKNRSFWSMIFTSSSGVDANNIEVCHGALQTTRAKLNVYLDELDESSNEAQEAESVDERNVAMKDYSKVFIVHGHDGELREKIARLLEKQGIEAIILREKANRGMTVIEKFEAYSEPVAAAICLFTADDDIADGSKRARQNVVFETGYFYGKIGRGNTIVIAEDDVMNLSDLKGIVYVNNNNWEVDVLRELRDIGYKIDFNRF